MSELGDNGSWKHSADNNDGLMRMTLVVMLLAMMIVFWKCCEYSYFGCNDCVRDGNYGEGDVECTGFHSGEADVVCDDNDNNDSL